MKSSRTTAYYQDNEVIQEARAAWNNHERSRSLKLFERAVKREPSNLMALKDAAYAFGQHYEIAKASTYIKRMAKLVGDDPGALHMVADAWSNASRPKESHLCLLKAVGTGKAHPETYLSLALAQERLHQLDNALDSVETFLQLKRNDPAGIRLKALILRRNGAQEDSKKLYRSLAEYCKAGDQVVLAQGLSELAQILDAEKDYAGAIALIQESKSILIKNSKVSGFIEREQKERMWFDQFLETLSCEHIREWASFEGGGTSRQFILTGCPRSGTTLMEKVLDAHSEVISAEELSVFSSYITPSILKGIEGDDFNAETLSTLPRSLLRRESKNYYRYMEAGMGEKIQRRVLIDKIPSSTMMIPLMIRLIPETRVLYALRDPRDIVISCYFCWMELNSVSVCFRSLEETVERTVCELEWWLRIKQVLPADSWREVRYEDTVCDLMGESQKLHEWMGVAWEDGVTNYRDHLFKRGVTSPTYEAVSKPVHKGAVGRWRNHEKLLEPYLDRLEALACKLGY